VHLDRLVRSRDDDELAARLETVDGARDGAGVRSGREDSNGAFAFVTATALMVAMDTLRARSDARGGWPVAGPLNEPGDDERASGIERELDETAR